ncbi:hypothetical protein [Aeromicrobium sp.]|uniref:hypothetical protein n=1 Tax=Aeromicrobium sp. TaxID=1871063 RepID=UPI00403404CD
MLFVVLRSTDGDTRTLLVSFTSTWGEPEVGCYLEENALWTQHLSGTRVLLSDAEGSVVGAGTLDPYGLKDSVQRRVQTAPTEQCVWSAVLDDLPDSDAYTINVETPLDGNETFTYTATELEEVDWEVVLSRN